MSYAGFEQVCPVKIENYFKIKGTINYLLLQEKRCITKLMLTDSQIWEMAFT
jgi:hypothetical protein